MKIVGLQTLIAKAMRRQFKSQSLAGLALALLSACSISNILAPQAEAQQIAARRLPPCTMDSFVREAGGHAEHIYGDEGSNGLPPYQGFGKAHRINAGIMDTRDAGLTTGHGSLMPDAWGKDEFLGAEWGRSGARGHETSDGFEDGTPVTGGPGGSGGPADYGPPPGEGYQPATTCEGFVGWYSPEEVALSQTDFPAAFEHFVYSGRYTGSMVNAIYILEVQMGRPQGGH